MSKAKSRLNYYVEAYNSGVIGPLVNPLSYSTMVEDYIKTYPFPSDVNGPYKTIIGYEIPKDVRANVIEKYDDDTFNVIEDRNFQKYNEFNILPKSVQNQYKVSIIK